MQRLPAATIIGIGLFAGTLDLIALIWTTLFYLVSRKFTLMARCPVVCGLLYGGVVYLVMNFIVLAMPTNENRLCNQEVYAPVSNAVKAMHWGPCPTASTKTL